MLAESSVVGPPQSHVLIPRFVREAVDVTRCGVDYVVLIPNLAPRTVPGDESTAIGRLGQKLHIYSASS